MDINKGIKEGNFTIEFSEDLPTELARLNADMRLSNLLPLIVPDSPLSAAAREDLRKLIMVLSDLFNTSLPPVEDDPLKMLMLAARDQHLSRLLKERGLARIYRLITLKVHVHDPLTKGTIELPAYQTELNPETGVNFKTQEEFLGWFCKNAHVPRSLVFMRMATYARLEALNMSLEEAFDVVLKKPYAAREVMNELGTWQGRDLVDVKPEVALRLTKAVLPEKAGDVAELVEALSVTSDPEEIEQIKEDLREIAKPAMRRMVEEVADHPSKRDAMDMVRHDIAEHPEIKYWYDPSRRWIVVEYVRKSKDVRGNSYIAEVQKIPLIPEINMPDEVLADIAKRLSFKNRELEF